MAGRHASHVAIFKNRRIQCGAVADVLTGENLENAFGVPTEVRTEPSGELSVRAQVEPIKDEND